MKKNGKPISRKTVRLKYIISIVALLAVFITMAVLYANYQYDWQLWICAIVLVCCPIAIFGFVTTLWAWKIEDLMTDYKKNNNVLVGGLALLLLFAIPFIAAIICSNIDVFSSTKGFYEGFATLMITAMPAFIGLLGVQYSVAIQENNRKQDLRLGAKPFFKVQCCKVAAIPDENGHTCHAMKIKVNITNISQSIGIPVKVVSCDSENCVVELPYTPLANKDVFEKEVEVTSEHPYGDKVHIAIIYKDVYENLYEMKITFIQHSKFDMSETEVLSDGLLANECTK